MWTNSVGRLALKITFTVSAVFLVVFASALFFYEHKARSAAIEWEIEKLREAQISGIVEGLWHYDKGILQALVDGISFYPYINYIAVEDMNGVVVSQGVEKQESRSRTYVLSRKAPNHETTTLGTLRIEIDTRRVLSDVTRQVLLSLSWQMIFLLFEALIVFFLFSTMVTKHLAAMANYIKTFGLGSGAPPLVLTKRHRGDELDILVESFNSMRMNLEKSRAAEVQAMNELKLSEKINRVLVDEAPDAILMYDVDAGHFISCNRRSESLFGRPIDEILMSTPADLFHPEQPDGLPIAESIRRTTSRALAGEPVLVRRRILQPNGTVLTCEVRITEVASSGRKIVRVSYLDISDRVKAEEAASRSLKEKEILLQEVYHRTKNNMQTIASLLNIEAMSSENDETVKTLNDMIGRILSMALVHQKLYESEDLSMIDLGDYLLDLVAAIKDSRLSERPEVNIQVDAESGIVAVFDVAVPCGLALNELIVNAARHAFPDGRNGVIRVSLRRGEPGTIRFSVEDDGVGLPPDFDVRRDGKLGLTTVVSLVELQLRGTLSFGPGPGTSCTAIVRDNIYGARV